MAAEEPNSQDKGMDVVTELYRLATATGVEGVFGVRGWRRTQAAQRPKRARRRTLGQGEAGVENYTNTTNASMPEQQQQRQAQQGTSAAVARRNLTPSLVANEDAKAGWGSWGKKTDAWEFVGGATDDAGGTEGGAGDGGVVVEVDALTDAIFVRAGAHLKHACTLLRGGGGSSNRRLSPLPSIDDEEGETTTARGPRTQEENKEKKEDDGRGGERRKTAAAADDVGIATREAAKRMSFMKLPAVSYVLRKTLGVRSYASRGLLPWGGPNVSNSRWSWGGGKGEEKLESSEASVPGSEFLPWECLSPSSSEPVLLSVTSLQELRALKPLLFRFKQSDAYDPYVVLSGPAALSPSAEFQSELEAAMVEGTGGGGNSVEEWFGGQTFCGVLDVVHDERGGDVTGEGNVGQARWATLLNRVSPVAVFAVSGATTAAAAAAAEPSEGARRASGRGVALGDTEGQRAARRACGEAEAEIAYVLLPAEDVPHSAWVTTLAPVALASWARPRFSVSVITNDRPRSLRRLMESLERSRLFGDEMAVDFYVESSADDETLRVTEEFPSRWGSRGLVQTHFRVLKGGLIRAVTESFFPSDRHHHAFLLEDDVEISPHFYAWSKWATLTYQYGAPSDFMRDMYGVSLYTPRVDELGRTRKVYDSNKLIAGQTGGALYSPYLHQLPCSWGGLYFPETWMEYRLYLGARLREDHVSVNIDGSRTNHWKTSWKRFFIEMAFQSKYYMLYPNFFNQTSFSTNWLEAGEHIKDAVKAKGEDGKPPPPAPKGDSKHLPKDYTVPLMEDRAQLVDPLPGGRLPPLDSLPKMDVLNRFAKKNKKKRQQ
ncbi:unnamed protein product [Pylaiella littoralis]